MPLRSSLGRPIGLWVHLVHVAQVRAFRRFLIPHAMDALTTQQSNPFKELTTSYLMLLFPSNKFTQFAKILFFKNPLFLLTKDSKCNSRAHALSIYIRTIYKNEETENESHFNNSF